MSRRKTPSVPHVVRRTVSPKGSSEQKTEGENETKPPGLPQLRDSRQVALIRGVANRSAREIFRRRNEWMQKALAANDRALVDQLLGDALLLELWRAGSLTTFEAYAELFADLEPEEARERGRAYNTLQGRDSLPEAIVAAWYRIEESFEEGSGANVKVSSEKLSVEFDFRYLFDGLQKAAQATAAIHRDQSEGSRPQRRDDNSRDGRGEERGGDSRGRGGDSRGRGGDSRGRGGDSRGRGGDSRGRFGARGGHNGERRGEDRDRGFGKRDGGFKRDGGHKRDGDYRRDDKHSGKPKHD